MAEKNQSPGSIDRLGEFGLIDRLVGHLRGSRADTVLGAGDDVAAIDLGGDRLLLATCDIQTAGTHFLLDRCDPFRLGRKVLAINLSDIAAAGGRPTHALVSLLLPADTEIAFLDELYRGLADEAQRHGVDVVGGNVSRGGQLAVDLFLLGTVDTGRMLRRDAARVGDRLLVTGTLGAAAAGLEALRRAPESGPDWDEARTAFETPVPRLAEGRLLGESSEVGAVIDVSDGLAADVGHLCERSNVGVRLEIAALPVACSATAVARAAGRDPMSWALAGGEDYELAFTARRDGAAELASRITARTGTRTTLVGEIVEPSLGRRLVLPDGSERPLDAGGFDHLKPR